MEVKVNKEIRDYTESMFFGLSLRQFVFSLLGCIIAVVIYFLFRESLGMEIVTWACVLGVAPCAAMGFLKYNGMPAEKFIWVWIKYQFLAPKQLTFRPVNMYYDITKPSKKKKRGKKNDDKNTIYNA